jgi:thiamine biosynthesis lipoprotein
MKDGTDRQFSFRAMGSPCLMRVAAAGKDAIDLIALQRALQAAVSEVLRIEKRYSRYRPDSIVSRINAAAGRRKAVRVDEETASLLHFASELHTQSDGLFDITSGVLRRVWDFKAGRCPEPQALSTVRSLIGWEAVEFDGQCVRLPRAGMELDFGGIGKEYAADRAATLLLEAGLRHGYVNLGGDLRLLGSMPDGHPWRLGIAHPRQQGQIISSVELSGGALATSGDYERFFEANGQRYSHILNPFTGWPVQHWQSVSVLAPACLAAGALSTVAMLKAQDAPDFLRAQGVSWLAIDSAGAVHRNDNLPDLKAKTDISGHTRIFK